MPSSRMSKPCGQLPSKPPAFVNVCFPWQDAPLPVSTQVYHSGGGGLRALSSSAAFAGGAVAARAAATATAPSVRRVMAPPWSGPSRSPTAPERSSGRAPVLRRGGRGAPLDRHTGARGAAADREVPAERGDSCAGVRQGACNRRVIGATDADGGAQLAVADREG